MEKKKTIREMDCPYCGSLVMVEQEPGEGLDELHRKAALICGCPEAEKHRTEDEIRICINKDMTEQDQINGLMSMIDLVRQDLYDSVKIEVGASAYKIWKNTKGALKFQRKENSTMERTIR